MKNTKIEWCDATFNPWIGCTKVSPGCANCYAETLMDTRMGRVKWGKGQPRSRTSAANWNQPVKWNREAGERESLSAQFPLHSKHRRPRVFCASLADWLDDEVPVEWLADLLDLVRRTPNLDWLLLTKRPENWRARIGLAGVELTKRGVAHRLHHWQAGEAPANIWVGTSVEDQPRADERIPALLSIPARVRFLSCEPLLGPVGVEQARKGLLGIDWVIAGGESGPGARPMHPDWARSLRDQCHAAGVAFFMKQMGGTKKPFPEIPSDLLIREVPGGSS
jgi:protein gp37